MDQKRKLELSLFSLRIGVFIVMFMWTIDKFINPAHTTRVYEIYYMIPGVSDFASYLIGTVQAVIVLAFVTGYQKKWSYGLVLVMHFISTASSYAKYLDPWKVPNLLFYAAFPMLAAIFALYLMRDEDNYLTI